MKRIFMICVMVVSFHVLNAQTQLEGKITDKAGNPLPGISVYLPDLNKGTVSSDKGEYLIEKLPKGNIKIQFSSIGYNTLVKNISIHNGTNRLNVSLSEAVIESQEVVVSGGLVTSQHENAVKIEVLKSTEIAASGSPNVMESITRVPGVDMIAKGQGISKPVIRGLSMNDILVLNNGVRIENYQFSENHPLGIDDNGIDRVEIIKGPASLLYGSDAIGGVLNFIKSRPAVTGTVSGDFRTQLYSNTNGMSNSLGLKGTSKHLFAGIRVNEKTHADYKQGGGDFVPNSRFNQWSLSSNAGYTGKSGTFKILYDYFCQKLGMTNGTVQSLITSQGRKNRIWYQDLDHHLISLQNKLYMGLFRWETNLAYQSAQRKLEKTLSVPSVEMNLHTFTYDSKLYFPSGHNSEYLLGFQGMSQTNRNHNDRDDQFLPDADVNNFGILGLARYTVLEKLKLQGGLRFDIYNTKTFAMGTEGTDSYHTPVSKDYSSLSGSLGATFYMNERLLLRGNLAKAYRVPNLSELTANGAHGNRYELGNSDLDPEDALEADASLHYHGKYLSLDLAGFYNHISDYIHLAPTSETNNSGMPIYRYSQANARLYGGEAGIHFHPVSLPWLHMEGSYSSVTGKKNEGNYLPFIPAGKFRYEIRAEKDKLGFLQSPSIWVSALSALKQDHPSADETATDGYTVIHAGCKASLQAGKQPVEIALTATNLFDKKYMDHLSTLKSTDYCNQGRNISLSLRLPFSIKR
ncbi:MAG: TonB-dependent receptor [Mangrovibacterium sp.]